jgi:hypothetical protein
LVETTSLFGTAVHAVLRSRAATSEQVRAVLAAEGLEVASMARVAASLEDVFLDVVDRADTPGRPNAQGPA